MRRQLLAATAAMTALGGWAAPASADHSWGSYHWARTVDPFTIQLGDNVGTTWDGHLATAASDWSADTADNPLNATVDIGQAKNKNCRPTSGQVEVCAASYGYTGWAGLAQIWVSGSHITAGVAKMNDTYMKNYGALARGHVMCQEVGHTFGLDHQDESGADLDTCMDYAEAFDNPHPDLHDYEQLAASYLHLDSTSTIGGTSASTGKAGRPGARPYRIDRHDGPRSSRIAERFSDGTARITFIDWARR